MKKTDTTTKYTPKKTKPLLTKLLLELIRENAKYETALKMIATQIEVNEEKNLYMIQINTLKGILESADFPLEPTNIPSYAEFIEEFAKHENET